MPDTRDETLEGAVVVVTGAAGGLGAAVAAAFAGEGARPVLVDLVPADATADLIEARHGTRPVCLAVDVKEADQVAAAATAVEEQLGGCTVLVNNAAVYRRAPLDDHPLDLWDETIAVNLRGPMLGCKHAIPRMLERGGGAIVNTSSAAALVGDPIRTAYGISKAGLDALTRYVATQYGKRGIRCNSIAPGVVATPALAANVPAEMIAIYERSHLTPRLGRPEEYAELVAAICTNHMLNGDTIRLDGAIRMAPR